MYGEVQDLLNIITQFGKYRYKKLPMGLKIAADMFQCKMCKLMEGIEGVLVYIDNLLVITRGTYEEHLEVVQRVLQ